MGGVDLEMSKLTFRWRLILIASTIAVLSIPASIVLFRPPAGIVIPVAVLPFVLVLKVFEGLALGTGICFLLFGYPLLKRAKQSGGLTLAAFISVAWYLVNWWPHDNLHLVSGIRNLMALLAIEYVFHLTMMLAGAVLAIYFYRAINASGASTKRGIVPRADRTAADTSIDPFTRTLSNTSWHSMPAALNRRVQGSTPCSSTIMM